RCARPPALHPLTTRRSSDLPRTAHRELVTGAMSVRHAWTGALVALVVFLGAAALLNPLCLALAPVAVILMVVYPYGKRFTDFPQDRKSTRLNSSHVKISYAV